MVAGTEQEPGVLPRAVEALLNGTGELSATHLHVLENRILDANSQEPVRKSDRNKRVFEALRGRKRKLQVLLEDKLEGLRCGDQVWTQVTTTEQVGRIKPASRPNVFSSFCFYYYF